jgi:hypothetical protein
MWTLQPPSPPHKSLPQHVGKVIVIIIVVIDVIVNVDVVIVVVVVVVILSSLSSLFFVILFVVVVINIVVVIAVITIALSSFVARTTINFAVTVAVIILREVDFCLVSRIFLTDPLGCSNYDDCVHVDTPTNTPTPHTSSTTC